MLLLILLRLLQYLLLILLSHSSALWGMLPTSNKKEEPLPAVPSPLGELTFYPRASIDDASLLVACDPLCLSNVK